MPFERVGQPLACGPGSVLSLKCLLQDILVQREVGNELFQAPVLLQPLQLVAVHATVFALPAVVGLLADLDVADGLGNGPPLSEGGLDGAELRDDLVGSMSGLLHDVSGLVEAPD